MIVRFFVVVSLCCVAEQVAMAQISPTLSTNVPLSEQQYSVVTRPGFNRDPRILRDIVTSEAAKRNCKAIEFGIWVDDSKILTMALGDSMTDVPALTTMHYRIGGIAETFMSTLLLMLVKQHRIDLDWTIGRWFPGLLAADKVTFRMLVANIAGYIDYVAVPDFVNLQESQPFRAFTDADLINYSVRDNKMNFPPGTGQRYSHTDNVILGQAIERATGRSIDQLYNENLFGPLGLENTYFPINQNIKDPVLHAFTSERSVKDHPFYEDCTYWNPSWGSTPGLPISDLDDLGKWGPILGTGRLLTPELFRETDCSYLGRQRYQQTRRLFCLWICRYQRLDCTESGGQRLQWRFRLQYASRRNHHIGGDQERDQHHGFRRLRDSPRGRQIRDPRLADRLLARRRARRSSFFGQ